MFHVGSFIEMYGYDALNIGKSMGLKIQSGKRGMAHVAGFPLRFEKPVIAKILNIGREVAVIKEAGAGRFVKQRHISDLYLIREWN
jgi:DNA mismatch repair ATPase MutS